MHSTELIPHLFRNEFRKISSVLCKNLGVQHLEAAEDIVSETFLSAMEVWPYKGVPANPTAWLYTVAKNKTKNYLRRRALFTEKICEGLAADLREGAYAELDLSDQNITDSQLQMLFAVCHPSLPAESQIGLALRILCGFGIDEIADAFLTTRDTINKRLFRAREKLREENVKIEFPPPEHIAGRLDSVLTTVYLLFNEGYYSESNDEILREDFCLEAIRLMQLIIDNPATDVPHANALFALMCFHASRFPARKDRPGEIILYDDQNEELWNYDLIAKGAFYLKKASTGDVLSRYHIEAAIAFWHTKKEDTAEKWENILQLYNKLLQIQYSPIAALNRTYALAKANGRTEAIAEAEKLRLEKNPYYYILLGELYSGVDNAKAVVYLNLALELVKTEAEKKVLWPKLDSLESGS
jgi:RNA polymerase sigma factor (sigma-70 family)